MVSSTNWKQNQIHNLLYQNRFYIYSYASQIQIYSVLFDKNLFACNSFSFSSNSYRRKSNNIFTISKPNLMIHCYRFIFFFPYWTQVVDTFNTNFFFFLLIFLFPPYFRFCFPWRYYQCDQAELGKQRSAYFSASMCGEGLSFGLFIGGLMRDVIDKFCG